MEDSITQTEGTTQQGEKTFSQDDVNRIIQERLARAKAEPTEKETALEKKEKELNAREQKIKAKELFAEKKLPEELIDILDYSDGKKLEDSIQILAKAFHARPGSVVIRGGKPAEGNTGPIGADPIRAAMGLKG